MCHFGRRGFVSLAERRSVVLREGDIWNAEVYGDEDIGEGSEDDWDVNVVVQPNREVLGTDRKWTLILQHRQAMAPDQQQSAAIDDDISLGLDVVIREDAAITAKEDEDRLQDNRNPFSNDIAPNRASMRSSSRVVSVTSTSVGIAQ